MKARFFLIFELVALFIGLPLIYHFNLIPGHKSIPLLVVFAYCLIWVFRKKDFPRHNLGIKHFMGWKFLLIRVTAAALIIFILTYFIIPESMFYILKKKFWLWLMIMIFYPLWSAYPQELIYRAYFFERFSTLFPNYKVMIIINGLLFGYLHIIFNNWFAVFGASVVGIVWAYAYYKHKSLLAVAIEHALVGNLIFTIGLGQYFYVPDF